MEYRQLGSSDLTISAVTLGAWGIGGFMWGGQDDDDAIAAIRRSIDLGVTTIDTAPVYGTGHSEELVGEAIKPYDRDKLQILTKFGLRWDGKGEGKFSMKDADGTVKSIVNNGTKESILEECDASLKRLGTDTIDLYQQHWPCSGTPVEESMEAVNQLLKQGKIRAAGVSNFDVALLDRARAVAPIVSLQPPYSMVRRGAEEELLPYCIREGLGVVCYSPMQLGLLTGKVTMDREFPETDVRRTNPYFKPENRRKVLDFLAKIQPIAEAHNATLAQLVINWTVHRQGITAALVGARNEQQATENAAALDFTLTHEDTTQIDALLSVVELDL